MRREQAKKLKEQQEKEPTNLEDMKVKELKEMAKAKEIKGYSDMKKEELIETLTAEENKDDE